MIGRILRGERLSATIKETCLMAQVGAEMVNPITKERFVWRQTAVSTGGEFAEADLFLEEGATVDPHIHPRQREDFRVEAGTLRLRVGREEHTLGLGDERSVAARTVHAWQNPGPGPAHVVLRFTPALRSEDFFETYCGLARDGKVNKKGLPSSRLQTAVLFHDFRHEIALPPPVRYVVGPPMALLARLGRRSGLRSRYPQYASD
jgi:quercetin dioxygenase-like cupin family protein